MEDGAEGDLRRKMRMKSRARNERDIYNVPAALDDAIEKVEDRTGDNFKLSERSGQLPEYILE